MFLHLTLAHMKGYYLQAAYSYLQIFIVFPFMIKYLYSVVISQFSFFTAPSGDQSCLGLLNSSLERV